MRRDTVINGRPTSALGRGKLISGGGAGDFAGRLDAEPTWVTDARGGEGFAELTAALLEGR